jgi:hypothetical protein
VFTPPSDRDAAEPEEVDLGWSGKARLFREIQQVRAVKFSDLPARERYVAPAPVPVAYAGGFSVRWRHVFYYHQAHCLESFRILLFGLGS